MHRHIPNGINKYIFSDALVAYLSWLVFFVIRKTQVEHQALDLSAYIRDSNFLVGGLTVAFYWIYIYTFSNTYQSIYTKSRIAEVVKTFLQSLIGCLFLSVIVVLDDVVGSYQDYYYLICVMILTHFIPTLFFRQVILFKAKSDLRSGKISFPTLIIGDHPEIFNIYDEVKKIRTQQGLRVDAIWTNLVHQPKDNVEVQSFQLSNLEEDLKNTDISHVILALSKEEREHASSLISMIDTLGINIKVIPELSETLMSKVKLTNPFDTILVDIDTNAITPWQSLVKKTIDLSVSTFALIILSPLLLLIALLIKRDSKGPIIYRQERIGRYNQPFTIYKFRSMYINAESKGPQLSNPTDNRITPIGNFLRKYRLDELPQFFNVLKGEMSLIGPRPERKHFAEQIIAQAPEYKYIYKFKPGITSLGMVRFGYASDVEDMIERMKYDLLYINNYSLLMDLRILIYTIIIIMKGKGV
ncbi:MAG TPA: exopolysaccharide biosynthesis polyprenyl glycosylphosphotransferase [Chitinophagales bacterium]|nr:exopolysaccharide biosynthesis polyprenyl glycosylphosphotransferase [Chitinophagales bacterium]